MSYEQQSGLGGFIYSPQDILDWMNRTNASISQLGSDISSSNVRIEFKSVWAGFRATWQQFYDDHQSWWSRLTGTVADEVANYEEEYRQWLSRYLAEPGNTGTLASVPGNEHSATNAGDLVNSVTKLILVGAAVYVAAVYVPPLLKSHHRTSSRA